MHEPREGKHKCTRCKKTKLVDKFYLDGRKTTGVSSWCKACSLFVARAAAKKRKKAKNA